MASRISFTAISASFAIRFGKRDAMAVMRSERVIVRILPSGHAFIAGSCSLIAIESREMRISGIDPQRPDDVCKPFGGFLTRNPPVEF